MKETLRNVQKEIRKHKLDAVLITHPPNMEYVLSAQNIDGNCFIGKNSFYFLTNFCFIGQAEKIVNTPWQIKLLKKGLVDTLAEICQKEHIKKLGVEENHILLPFFNVLKTIKNIEIVLIQDILEPLRIIKSKHEIAQIKKACIKTTYIFKHILKSLSPGKTEKEVGFEIDCFLKKEGDIAFETIVAGGPHSSFPHANKGSRKLKKGDAVIFDIGLRFNGYVSDFTRTIFIGKASRKQKEIYNIVLEAQKKAIAGIKQGVVCSSIDGIARKIISENGFGKFFGHGLGHGVGIEVHEKPYLSCQDNTVLKQNMVLTVEPGIYFKDDFGVRIEDTVLVMKNGCEVLTDFTKNLIEI